MGRRRRERAWTAGFIDALRAPEPRGAVRARPHRDAYESGFLSGAAAVRRIVDLARAEDM